MIMFTVAILVGFPRVLINVFLAVLLYGLPGVLGLRGLLGLPGVFGLQGVFGAGADFMGLCVDVVRGRGRREGPNWELLHDTFAV